MELHWQAVACTGMDGRVMAQSTAQIFEEATIQELSDDRRFNNLTFVPAQVRRVLRRFDGRFLTAENDSRWRAANG